jgi:hypothetical protein
MRRLLTFGALVFAASVGTARATTITFEDHAVASGTQQILTVDLTSGGFFFDTLANHYHLSNNFTLTGANVDDGSTYFVTDADPSVMTFSQVGGAAFALNSIDYAEWVDTNAARKITATGFQVGGATVSADLILDGIFDGQGGAADFQTFAFDSTWTNLLSVKLVGSNALTGNLNYFAIDDIVVSDPVSAAVPEPATLTLVGFGCAYLVRRRRTRS